MLNITSRWQNPEILIFVARVYYEKLGHMLRLVVPKFRSNLFVHLRDIAEKPIPETIVVCRLSRGSYSQVVESLVIPVDVGVCVMNTPMGTF